MPHGRFLFATLLTCSCSLILSADPLPCPLNDVSSFTLSGVVGFEPTQELLLPTVSVAEDAVLSSLRAVELPEVAIGIGSVDVTNVPEPATLLMLGIALVGVPYAGRKLRRRGA